jgi:hypothetical protein
VHAISCWFLSILELRSIDFSHRVLPKGPGAQNTLIGEAKPNEQTVISNSIIVARQSSSPLHDLRAREEVSPVIK